MRHLHRHPPTREELRELGYFDETKVLVLRELRGTELHYWRMDHKWLSSRRDTSS